MIVFPTINIRTKHITLISLILLGIVSSIMVSVDYYRSNLNSLSGNKCSGILELNQFGITSTLSVVFRFHDKYHADIILSGDSKELDKPPTRLYKKISFSYSHNTNGSLAMSDIEIKRYASDNIDNEYFKKNIIDFPKEGGRLMFRKFENTLVFYNSYSPVMICEIEKLG